MFRVGNFGIEESVLTGSLGLGFFKFVEKDNFQSDKNIL